MQGSLIWRLTVRSMQSGTPCGGIPEMETVSSRLIVPSRLSYLAPIMAYVGELARNAGFDDREVRQIHLAIEEAVANVIQHGYSGREDAVFELICEHAPTSLTFRIREKGIPFDLARLSGYSPELVESDPSAGGLGSYLMKCAMDTVSFHNLGRAGKEICLTRFLSRKHINSFPDGDADKSTAHTEQTGPTHRTIPSFTVRDLNLDEIVEVSRCAYRTYGYTYHDYIYYPEQIKELMQQGLLYPAVAVAEAGEIIGHAAIRRSCLEDSIAEIGAFFITPEFRGGPVFLRLSAFLKQKVAHMDLQGVFLRSITAHTISQRGAAHFGFADCGLLIGVPPEQVDFSDLSAGPRQMGTRVLSYLSLSRPRERVIYPPPELLELIQRLYASMNIPAVEGRHQECAAPTFTGATESVSSRTMATNVADIEILNSGNMALDVVRQRLHHHRLEGAAVIFLHLNLEDPQTGVLASTLLSEGFLFAGILPHGLKGHDALILQYLNTVKVSYDLIHLHTPLSKELLDYVRRHDPASSL